MEVTIIDENTSSIVATKMEWAGLSLLLEWLTFERNMMDEATCLLEDDERDKILFAWHDSIRVARD